LRSRYFVISSHVATERLFDTGFVANTIPG